MNNNKVTIKADIESLTREIDVSEIKKSEQKKHYTKLKISLFIISIIILTFYTLKMLNIELDKIKFHDELRKMLSVANIKETNNNKEIIIGENKKKLESDPFYEYTDIKLIDVNIKNLKKENPNTVGWIQVNGTKINYPFFQYEDNEYYQKHSLLNSKNSIGSIYEDSKIVNKDKKDIILYGSNTLLNPIFVSSWLINNNHTIRLSMEYENTLWQVFGIYNNNDKYFDPLNDNNLKSIHNFFNEPDENSRILTIITTDKKKLIKAKLIKVI